MPPSALLTASDHPTYVRLPPSTGPTHPMALLVPAQAEYNTWVPQLPLDGRDGPVGSSFQGGNGRVDDGRKPHSADPHAEDAYEDRRRSLSTQRGSYSYSPPLRLDLPVSVPANMNRHFPDPIATSLYSPGPRPSIPQSLPPIRIELPGHFPAREPTPPPYPLANFMPRSTSRSLAPLRPLNRSHPYKRDYHDQRALDLLGQNSVTVQPSPDLGDTPSPGTMSATYGFGVDPYRETGSPGVNTRDSFLTSVEAAITHRLSPGGSSDVGLANALRAQMIDVCSTKDLYRRVLSLEGWRAQKWLDALQMMLDREPLSPNPSETRRAFLKALLRLSEKTGLCPNTLQLGHQVHKGDEPVDEGSFGEVYQGRIANRMVAVKVFRVNQRTDMPKLMKTVWREAIIWCQLYHPNVLPCYGIHRLHNQSYRIGLVSPWMGSGNIVEYLRNNPLAKRLLLLSDIASGMSYLHENKIVHGDLKGPNILVSASGRACLADFGLSRLADPSLLGWTSVRTATAKSTGTTRWQAPELLDPNDDANSKTTTASDVYSYGCVCYEVMTGNVPFYLTKNHYSIPMLVVAGNRPQKPDLTDPAYQQYGLTEPIWSFIEACWEQDPDWRPTAVELRESSIFSSLPDHRPTQDWGETSAAEFRRWAAPS